MEHLLLPSDGDGLPLEYRRVPWLGGTYDRGSFTEWPKRNRRPELHFEDDGCDDDDDDHFPGIPHPAYTEHYSFALEEVMQTWLIFGLLHAFFDDDFEESDFLEYDDNGSGDIWLTTVKLNPLLQQWAEKRRDDSAIDLHHLFLCIAQVDIVKEHLCHPSVDSRLALCIMTIAETLNITLGQLRVPIEMSRKQPPSPNAQRDFISNGGQSGTKRPTHVKRKGTHDHMNYPSHEFWDNQATERPRIKYAFAGVDPLASHAEIQSFFESEHLWDKYAFQIMVKNNWCPYYAKTSLDLSKNLCATIYLSCLEKPASDKPKHQKCTKHHCQRSQSPYEELQEDGSTHITGCDGCNETGVTGKMLKHMEAMIMNGKIPVLKVEQRDFEADEFDEEEGNRAISKPTSRLRSDSRKTSPSLMVENSITIVPYKSKMKYTAISHVWSDGFGNPHSNELRLCQIKHMVKAIEYARATGGILPGRQQGKKTKKPKTRTEFVWIDTLCCPVNNKLARAKVISKMRSIYANADLVLVLDGQLRQLDIVPLGLNISLIYECWARLLTSGWMRRLWTLQEAVFAKHVLVGFRDIAFPLLVLGDAICKAISSLEQPPQYRVVASAWLDDVSVLLSSRRPLQAKAIGRGAHGRLLSRQTDEPLCLGALFGLHDQQLAQLAATSSQDRFKLFWKMISLHVRIRSEIIFYNGPTLNDPEVSWAPKSLTDIEANEVWATCKDSECRAEAIDGGLRVRLPGAELIPATYPWIKDCQKHLHSLLIVRDATEWLLLNLGQPAHEVATEIFRPSTRTALLLGHFRDSNLNRKGVIACRRTDDKLYRIICKPSVIRAPEDIRETFDNTFRDSQSLFSRTRSFPGQNQSQDSSWKRPIENAAKTLQRPYWRSLIVKKFLYGDISTQMDLLQAQFPNVLYLRTETRITANKVWDLKY